MNVKIANSLNQVSDISSIDRTEIAPDINNDHNPESPRWGANATPEEAATTAAAPIGNGLPGGGANALSPEVLASELLGELAAKLKSKSPQGDANATPRSGPAVAMRIAKEVERICQKSDRIKNSGQVHSWQLTLGRHRLQKCLEFYKLGSHQGRVELHSQLSSIVYRHVAPNQNLSFQARYNLIEDFLQNFYIEVLRAFRREHEMPADYTPRTQLELAEYMAFTEQYAKRRINLPGRYNQQLIVLRAQGFANGQPKETVLDIEQAVEFPKGEEAEAHNRSYAVQQVREQMISEAADPSDKVVRDRVIAELMEYLESQNQSDCIDYLVLKLQDLSAPEIDSILGLSPRQRDYLQQRFKYHVEKFARQHNWKLVHQWLGADIDQNLGMSEQQWQAFVSSLTPENQQLLKLKRSGVSDADIARSLKCSAKQLQKRWSHLLELAWQSRNA
ncbi:HetZ-related protein [[Phormidium] sp. ETS-05]|uniref:HetZ-related protein n=1 Tax=[Phormidium] sp. ETS-05 TaxID=222819 RepID=UPI0018EF068A|nr:HetZ-related protein [[Phormidium] sp. ETS-05]